MLRICSLVSLCCFHLCLFINHDHAFFIGWKTKDQFEEIWSLIIRVLVPSSHGINELHNEVCLSEKSPITCLFCYWKPNSKISANSYVISLCSTRSGLCSMNIQWTESKNILEVDDLLYIFQGSSHLSVKMKRSYE